MVRGGRKYESVCYGHTIESSVYEAPLWLTGLNLWWHGEGPEGGTGPLGSRFWSRYWWSSPRIGRLHHPIQAIVESRRNRTVTNLEPIKDCLLLPPPSTCIDRKLSCESKTKSIYTYILLQSGVCIWLPSVLDWDKTDRIFNPKEI